MKVLTEPHSGKRGQIVAIRTRYGQAERQHTVPANPRTAAQRRARADFGGASAAWSRLTEEQRQAWDAAAQEHRSRPRLGQSGELTGQNLFTEINTNQALLDLPAYAYPPERPDFGSNPVGPLRITNTGGRPALKLSVSGVPAGHILVYGAAPCNAGRRFCKKFKYLGPLPAPDKGEGDITAQYVKEYGMPRPGSRVIICTRWQVNGWRDTFRRTDAIVPASQAPATASRRRRPAVATQ